MGAARIFQRGGSHSVTPVYLPDCHIHIHVAMFLKHIIFWINSLHLGGGGEGRIGAESDHTKTTLISLYTCLNIL